MTAFTTIFGVLLLKFCALSNAQSSFVSSAFINPASPSNVNINDQRRTRSSASTPQNREILPGNIITGIAPKHGMHGIPLYAKKKKKSSNEGKSGKIQVKLTKDVAGTGVIGTVIKVAPAFFENKLKRTQSAVRISDEEVAKENSITNEKNKVKMDTAMATKEKIDELVLSLSKKTGPDGRLFGGVSHKLILEELGKELPEGALGCKQVTIKSIKSEDGIEVDRDIKQTGEYKATIRLLDDISAEFGINVISG